jgi:hypothetical protein
MRRAVAVALLVAAGVGVWSVITPGAAAQQAKAKPASTSVPSSAADLDVLLGPVALYPDTLLAQILLCANNPTQVTRLAQWLPVNKLTGTELQDAATVDGFDPEFVALALFPTVVTYMNQNLDWTTKLGKAFTANKTAVFDSIQRLRAKAQKAGALKDSPQQNVETKTTSSGQEVIVIEPANPQVIYVPQYNPTVVYVTQPATQTVVVEKDSSADAAVAGLIGFTAGIAIGAAIDNDYYYGPYGWHGGAYMYNDAWDDYYDAREDAREDWMDHREDLYEERGERRENTQEQRTDRAENRQENRPESSAQRQQNAQQAQQARASNPQAGTQSTTRSTTAGSREARGYSGDSVSTASRSGTKSDAFSGYSSGKSERAASSRGSTSRSGSSGGGGRRR